MKAFWNNIKAFLNTWLLLICYHLFYTLAIRHVFSQSLIIVFALAILFVFVLRKWFFILGAYWLIQSYKKANSLFLLRWIIPVFTLLFYSLSWSILLIQDVWATTHPIWVKIMVIILFLLLILTWSYSVIKTANISLKAKIAFRSGKQTFTLDDGDDEESNVSDYTLN